jgi:Fic family protein
MASKTDFQREYQKTHPWISFSVDFSELDHETWLLLGEVKSKCEHIMGSPLLPESLKKLMRIYLAKGALATTAIEGNTLTEEEVQKRIDGTLNLPPSKEYLGKEIDNVVLAINKIGNDVIKKKNKFLTYEEILEDNRMILTDLSLEEGVTPGVLRNYPVTVTGAGYRGVPSQDIEFLMNRYVDWINTELDCPENKKIIYGALKAIIAHIYFVWIHPFGDGNGRTARLIEFKYLLSVGVPAAAAHLLSNHYNETRSEYYRQLTITSRSNGDLRQFIKYALQGFVDGLAYQINYIREDQLYVHWVNYIHRQFDGKNRVEDDRRKTLVLELNKQRSEVDISEVRRISGLVAEKYAGLSDKTVQRDISILISMKLLRKNKKKIICNWGLLRAFTSPTI